MEIINELKKKETTTKTYSNEILDIKVYQINPKIITTGEGGRIFKIW